MINLTAVNSNDRTTARSISRILRRTKTESDPGSITGREVTVRPSSIVHTAGDLNDIYISLRSSSEVVVSSLTSRGKGRTPPYEPSFAAVCKYRGNGEGSSSPRTTDRGASYRIPLPFVFAIRDYVTTMIHDDIYFGISSGSDRGSFLLFPVRESSRTFLPSRGEPRAFSALAQNKSLEDGIF